MDSSSCRCHGAANGFGLDDLHMDGFPGGRECFLRFLSIGNQGWEQGEAVIQQLKDAGAPKIMLEEFTEGEGFLKSSDLVATWLESLPRANPGGPWAVIKPLKDIKADETPKAVAFLVDPDQLSALTVLANFPGPGIDRVRIPSGSGCTCFGLYAFHEAEQDFPRAIIGLTDISARFYLSKTLGRDILSFTAPWNLFKEMEANAPESFLTRFAWKSMRS
ncbi:MAG: DUF169 domain-containing protein [Holophagales bacterium]|jgi:hypothetical protein|nr:DUF169 domain-containing protein [Holophagales bacterium]